MSDIRIRQLVFAAKSLKTAYLLEQVLGLGAPYPDPGVGEFGLTNAVYALGDQFLEVVVPVKDDAPAQRFIDKVGEGGYMAIFQVPDLGFIRQNADKIGIRRVWNADLDDIAASHFHPADIGGAIVSVDQPVPPESWRWGGPRWTDNSVPGSICGATLTAKDPIALTERWTAALTGTASNGASILQTTDGPVEFTPGSANALTVFHLSIANPAAALKRAEVHGLTVSDGGFTLAGVRIELTEHVQAVES